MKKILLCLVIIFAFVCPANAALTAQQAENVWAEVAVATELNSLPFYVKADDTPNAWVSAGQSVTVTTSLLELLDSESELYGVLSHEAGHVKLNHSIKTVGRTIGKTVAVSVLNSLFGGIAGNVANLGATLASAGYSREQEIQADDFAIRLAYSNEKDVTGLYSALLKLSKVHKTQPSGFNSHPPDDRRLLHIRNTIKSLRGNIIMPNG